MFIYKLVGKTGFEPATPRSQTECSTKLSHFPILMVRPRGVEPLTFWSVVKCSIQLSYERSSHLSLPNKLFLIKKWWLQLESNQRHQDFQSCALPTELWSHMAVRTGLEPVISRVTGERDNHYTNEP